MWKCQKCGKPVFFAERKQSLGFDWHPYCLKCEECGKVLTPGQHAEHAGGPFCHIPCYAALFGPKLFGHGSTTESHRSFGRREASFVREQGELENKLEKFNQFYAEKPRAQVSSRQVNGRLLLEGVLTIYWGTESSVRLKEFGDNRLIARQRKAMSLGFQFEDVTLAPVVKGQEGESMKIEDEEEVEVEEDPPALPYFDPSTHPLAKTTSDSGNLEDMTDLLPSAALNNQNHDQEDSDLEDLDTDGFLSYDPLHKWQTLTSLCPPPSTSPAPSSSPPAVSATLKPEALVRRSFSERLNGAGPLAIPGLADLSSPSKTLPASLSSITDDLDELLAVERKLSEHERVYHTVSGGLPVQREQEQGQKEKGQKQQGQKEKEEQEGVVRAIEELVRNNIPPGESLAQENLVGKRFLVEKCPEDSGQEQLRDMRATSAPVPEAAPVPVPAPDSPVQLRQKPVFQLGSYQPRPAPAKVAKLPSKAVDHSWEPPGTEERKGGPRALRRRPGKKMARQAKLCRRSSINGHWYDRETSVFLPPKHSPMSVYTSSLATHTEVLQALLAKYKVEADPGDFALYLVNETGERRLLGETEFPLLLRVRTGPHEEIAKLYLMDKRRTEEITHQVAAFLRFSYAELRSFLNMFYEEEEGEADRIRTKYLLLRRRLQRQEDVLVRNEAIEVINPNP